MSDTVREWPAYLLKGIPDDTDRLLEERAAADEVSVSDVIRSALCAKYGMDCPPKSVKGPSRFVANGTILVRMHPDLYARIKQETAQQYGAVRRLILTTIDAYLEAP